MRLLECDLVPPFAVTFFSRDTCGDELRFDESLKTCADFDLWLRISHLPIARIPVVLGGTRLSDASMTRRVGTYAQYIRDKTWALERYLSLLQPSPLADAVRRRSAAGLYAWSAESIYDIEGRRTRLFEQYVERAAELDPGSPRVAELAARPEHDPARHGETDEEEEEEDVQPSAAEPALAARVRAALGRIRV